MLRRCQADHQADSQADRQADWGWSSSFHFLTGIAVLCTTAHCGGELTPDDQLASQRAAVITRTDDPDCPPGIPCDEVPAGYALTNPMTGAYGNYDLADREHDGLDIRY